MILVFGATGYIGRYLCPYLKQQGYDVLALGRSNSARAFLESKGVRFQYFDMQEENAFDDLPKHGIDAIVDLATVLPEIEGISIDTIFTVNTVGVAKILEYSTKVDCKKVVMASTHKVSNNIVKDKITEDDEDFNGPDSPYIISKLAAEKLMEYYAKDFGMDNIVLRFTGVHGYGEMMGQLHADGSYSMSAFEYFVTRALNGETIEVYGDQSIKRDHVYIKDVLQAIELAIQVKNTHGICTIASGIGYSQYEEALAIAKTFVTSKQSEVVLKPEKKGLTRGYVYDISKAKKMLGYKPQYDTPLKMLEDYYKEWKRKEYRHYRKMNEADKPATFNW